jgi:hypothetical protein
MALRIVTGDIRGAMSYFHSLTKGRTGDEVLAAYIELRLRGRCHGGDYKNAARPEIANLEATRLPSPLAG